MEESGGTACHYVVLRDREKEGVRNVRLERDCLVQKVVREDRRDKSRVSRQNRN